MTDREEYYLIDLERSIRDGLTAYWKGNRHGYVRELKEAGLFSKEFAEEQVAKDFNKRTVMISKKEVKEIFRWGD